MTPVDPMAVAVDWLDAYRATRINQIVGMYRRDAVIECACEGRKIIHGGEAIAAYWRHRFVESPALDLEDIQREPVVGNLSNQKRCRSGPLGSRLR